MPNGKNADDIILLSKKIKVVLYIKMTTVLFLICFFIVLIIYQVFLAPSIEGYQDYSTDPLILGKQNAGNIQVLREQLNGLMGLNDTVKTTNKRVDDVEKQVKGLIDAQQQAALDVMPEVPVE
jgi:hypothetical protein